MLLQRKSSLSFIAETIGVSVSTVYRERKRNSNAKGVYDRYMAALRTRRRKAKPPGNRSIIPYVRGRVFEPILREQWSPEQVSGWLCKEEGLRVSKSTTYNWIATIIKNSIHKHLRHGGRKPLGSCQGRKIPIPNRIFIDERSAHAIGRTLGDWEMDTLSERKSSFMLMEKLDTGKQAVPLAHTVVRLFKGCELPVRTITTDNGMEFAAHEIIAMELKNKGYFAHSYSSWEKGAIENMNGLIRQYIIKKVDFKRITKAYIRQIVEKLNNRPRKKNGFVKPKKT